MKTSAGPAVQREAIADSVRRADAGEHEGEERYQRAMQRYIRAISSEPPQPAATRSEGADAAQLARKTALQSGPWGSTLVGDVMTSNVIVVKEHDSFKHIAATLTRNRVSAVPVVDATGRVLGVVSESDLLAKVAAGGDMSAKIGSGFAERRNLQRKAHGETAADLMSSPAVTALPTDAVVDAARVAAKSHIRRLPVVDEAERVVGIVTRSDLLRAFLGDDVALEQYINDVVLTRQFVLSPTSITASVVDGVVTLRGRLDSEQVLGPLSEALRGIAGVVALHCELSFDAPYRFAPPAPD